MKRAILVSCILVPLGAMEIVTGTASIDKITQATYENNSWRIDRDAIEPITLEPLADSFTSGLVLLVEKQERVRVLENVGFLFDRAVLYKALARNYRNPLTLTRRFTLYAVQFDEGARKLLIGSPIPAIVHYNSSEIDILTAATDREYCMKSIKACGSILCIIAAGALGYEIFVGMWH